MTDSPDLPTVTITTDGAARGNPGPGGWAALLEVHRGEKVVEKLISGEECSTTTNNAMEIQAVVGGLTILTRRCNVTLRVDSMYVIKGIARLQAGYSVKPDAKNHERWIQLEGVLKSHIVSCEWVKGHAGDARNERVNEAAEQAAARAYEAVEQENKQERETANDGSWTLAICSPGVARPVRWMLETPTSYLEDEVAVVGMTEPTAVWQGLVQGLSAAYELAQGEQVRIIVITNYELIIKQGRGEWRVKNPVHQPLAVQMDFLRNTLGEVHFQYAKAAELQQRFGGT